MGGIEPVVKDLYVWTPFLAAGFMWNIVISLVALIVGTGWGYVLARLRLSPHDVLSKAGNAATELMRNIPTFVFQFYLVFMLPDALSLPSTAVQLPFPSWLKAALALALAVAGFVSDNLLLTLSEPREERRRAMLLFVSNWGHFFVVIVMASSTASVIGVSELVSRCNTVINVIGKTEAMLWVYLYAMTWFFLFCYSTTVLILKLSRRLDRE
ncbi:ABC transporter permease subunit [Paraburkholderia sp. IMGN_8]|uniref:ABC transporter permease subunit n=1 Tax=Paraburkholderia sp. IMGN_8 TaxID=3136564 RepID=UPI0031017C2F